MQAVMHDLGLWFWRLVPANPILVRVVLASGRRPRHFWIRLAYLSVLALVTVFGVIWAYQAGGSSLADLAKRASQVFERVCMLQLAMVCILAPIFTAGAITQEKDSQTFDILLSTPLSNGQIVLGSMLSRLYFVFMLLLAGVPLFCIMMVYGGVTGERIAQTIGLAACTALFTGAIAIAISVMKIGTGRTIFSFYLAIAMYLIIVYVLSQWPGSIPVECQPAPGRMERMSWLAAFHPFLSLRAVLGQTPAPHFGTVSHYGIPRSMLLAYPHLSFMFMTTALSGLLVSTSLFFVRRGVKQGELSWWHRFATRKSNDDESTQVTRKPRHVWHNPVAWREAVTGAAAGGSKVARFLLLGVGLTATLALLVMYGRGRVDAAEARLWLLGMVLIEMAVALFISAATAATSMTREKESNTLELLLATPITSAQILKGKIRGLVAAAGPMLAVPVISVAMFILFDLISRRAFKQDGPVVFWEAVATLPAIMVAYTAIVCMIGLQFSIKCRRTLTAVFGSMGVVIVAMSLLSGCFFGIGKTDQPLMVAALMPLSPVTAASIILSPAALLSEPSGTIDPSVLTQCRLFAAGGCAVVAGLGWLFSRILLHGMVREFDMIIRKQSA
jgi:ABC-type transport system involved in multi-copper enzyme maturation permease subunit